MQQTSVSSVRTTSRDSNLELLRIVCMYMIILHHLIAHGVRCVGYSAYPMESFDFQRQFPFVILNAFCVVAVNCYVLISGYFGIKPTFKKLLRLFFICAFYSIIHYLIIYIYKRCFLIETVHFFIPPFLSHSRALVCRLLHRSVLNFSIAQYGGLPVGKGKFPRVGYLPVGISHYSILFWIFLAHRL